MKTSIKFNNVNTLFSQALKQTINNYFDSTAKNKTGDRRIFFKATILLVAFAVLYSILVFVQPH